MMIDSGEGASMSYALAYNNGQVFMAGHTTTSMTLTGPDGTSVAYNDADGKTDMWVGKVALDGAPLAVYSVAQGNYTSSSGGSSFGLISDIQDFGDDHLAVTGYFDGGSLTWGSSGITMENLLSYSNSFVAKVSTTDGSTVWATLQASDRETKNNGVDVDASGDVYAVGYYYSCSPCSETPIYSNGAATGEFEAVEYGSIFKYAGSTGETYTAGEEMWSKKWTEVGSFGAVRVDSNGLYVSGSITGANVDLGSGVTVTSADGGEETSALVMKLDFDGNPVWAKAIGSSAYGFDLHLSADGESVYVGGGSGGAWEDLTGELGGLAARLSASDGSITWVIDAPYLRGIKAGQGNADGKIFFMSGAMSSITNFQGHTFNSRGSTDVCVGELDAADGTLMWGADIGGTAMEYPWGCDIDPDGNVYMSGLTQSAAVTLGTQTILNTAHVDNGGADDGVSQAYLLKLDYSSQAPPSCLSSCTGDSPTVNAGYCYIDGYCYADGDGSPYDEGWRVQPPPTTIDRNKTIKLHVS
jgi:hypothetical protein